MEVQVKSVTIYVRESQLEKLLTGQDVTDFVDIVWTLTPGDPSSSRFNVVPQAQVQVSVGTYYNLLDSKPQQNKQPDIDEFDGFASYI